LTDATSQTNAPATQLPPLWRWYDILLIVLASVAIILGGTFALAYLYPVNDPVNQAPPMMYILLLTSLEAVGILASVYVFGVRRKHLELQELGFRRTSLMWMVLAGITALIFIPVIGLIALGVQMLLGLPLENPQLEFLVPKDFSAPGALVMILLGGIVIPIAEEVFFRGVLYRWMRQYAGRWLAIVASSLVFGALHGDISVAAATFIMGIVLAWFYEYSGSLWTSILIHATNNTLKLLLLYLLLALGIQIPPIA
jgi:membrane protease YdiL (CAAX protease family)